MSETYLASEVTPSEFWFNRITDDERGKMWALGQADGGGVTLDLVQRGRLLAFLNFTSSNPFQVTNREVVFIINAMETVGALDPGRAAEILAV